MNGATQWLSNAAWRRLAPGLLLMAALLLLFHDTAKAMVTIWIRSDTFAHAFLVPPIVVWMVWRRRDMLATLQPRAAPWALIPIAAVCLLWLLGELSGVNSATQFALVALLVLSVPAVFGLQVARALTFPLMFMFFAVPFGEFMVPHMMEWTADFTVAALQATGVPVYREGLQFVIPSGSWSVVEACSGVRYLIASFMVGTLFAYLNFRSTARRTVFMVASLLVPIVANWLRAYMIVMLGHLSGNRLAVGVDHIIYGWVFFGLVIGVMFMLGARWAEPDAQMRAGGGRALPSAAAAAAVAPPRSDSWWVGGAMVLMLLATQAAFWRLDQAPEAAPPVIALPSAWGDGWVESTRPVSTWIPAFSGARATAARSYSADGRAVAVWVGYYRDQGYDRKLVTSTNGMTELRPEAQWAQVGSGTLEVPLGTDAGQAIEVLTGDLRGSNSPGSANSQRLRVWQLYWIGGRLMTSDAGARLQLALNRLRGRGDDSAVIFFYTAVDSAQPDQASDAALRRFVAAALPRLTALLSAARGAD